MGMQEYALEEAALKTLEKAVTERLRAVKALMQEELIASGVSRVDAMLPNGTKVATISRTTASMEAKITDPDAFLKWVRDFAPTEISTRLVTEVRPAFVTQLLAEMTAAGRTEVIDKATGVVEEVPGAEIRPTRSTSHSVRPVKDGGALIAAAMRDGQISTIPELLAARPEGEKS